jgi:putative DNA primase/helicase
VRLKRPEERVFELDLHEWVPAHRGELAAAALTIMRAYLAAGAPKQDIKNYARFETWSRWVRSSLVWLGMPDPCETRTKIETADPVREQLRGLLETWHRVYPRSGATLKQATMISTAEGHEDLHAALIDIAEGSEHGVSLRKVGKFIAAHERRIEGGLRFERAGTHQNAVLWRATKVGESAADPGEFGEFREFVPFDAGDFANSLDTHAAKSIDPDGTNSPKARNSPKGGLSEPPDDELEEFEL